MRNIGSVVGDEEREFSVSGSLRSSIIIGCSQVSWSACRGYFIGRNGCVGCSLKTTLTTVLRLHEKFSVIIEVLNVVLHLSLPCRSVSIHITRDSSRGGAGWDSGNGISLSQSGISGVGRDKWKPLLERCISASLNFFGVVVVDVSVLVVDPCCGAWCTTITVGGDNSVGTVAR